MQIFIIIQYFIGNIMQVIVFQQVFNIQIFDYQ